jgi:hypothetical protein
MRGRGNPRVAMQIDLPIIVVSATVIVQIVTMVWWASRLTSRVEFVETWIAGHVQTAERLARLEQSVLDVHAGIGRVEKTLRVRHTVED